MEKDFVQYEHIYFRFSCFVFTCFLMADLECKIAEQLGNEHGMSSGFLCVRLCWDKELFVLKNLSQISQRNWGFSSWVLKCLARLILRRDIPHTGQTSSIFVLKSKTVFATAVYRKSLSHNNQREKLNYGGKLNSHVLI